MNTEMFHRVKLTVVFGKVSCLLCKFFINYLCLECDKIIYYLNERCAVAHFIRAVAFFFSSRHVFTIMWYILEQLIES